MRMISVDEKLTRREAIEMIAERIEEEDIIVSTTGMISRELYDYKDRPLNFYMMGSMGNSLAVGLGMALNINRHIVVISGDASALMSLGTMVLHNKLRPENLTHYILDNECHSSTGGQKTCSRAVNFEFLAPRTRVIKIYPEKGEAPRIPYEPDLIVRRFRNAIEKGGWE